MIHSILNRFYQSMPKYDDSVANSILDSLDRTVLITDEQGCIVSALGRFDYFRSDSLQSLVGTSIIQIVPLLDEFFDSIDRTDQDLCDRLMTNAAGDGVIVDLKIRKLSGNGTSGWAFVLEEKSQESHQRDVYHRILEPIHHRTGEDFFEALVTQLRKVFGCRYAFVATVDEDLTIAKSIRFSKDGDIQPNFQYDLKGTPCENVLQKSPTVYTKNVSKLFPEDVALSDLGIESYFGVSLMSSEGNPVGILVAMDTEPAEDWPDYKDLLEVFSARCSAELARHHATVAMEQAIQQKEHAIRSKDIFFANMSHEIRTPLSSILGYVDVLADCEVNDNKRQESAEVIRRNGEQLLTLVNDVLDLSKIETGQLKLERSIVLPQSVVEEAIEITKFKAHSKNLKLDIHIDTKPIPEIETDRTRFRQVLVNVLSNSIKFSNDDGQITVTVREVQKHDRRHICINVVNNNQGITSDKQRRIFEAFGQGDSSVTTNFGETGLALAVSQRLVEMLGGQISVENEPENGTRFQIQLPVDAGQVHEDRTPTNSGQDSVVSPKIDTKIHEKRSPKVLIAEDHLDNLKLFGHILTAAGFDVVMVENGEEACQRVAEAEEEGLPFDAVLMDMRMPVLDGYQATTQLRENDTDLPIIAVTAYAMIGDREKCLDAGCTDFLAKPFDKRELVGMVRAHIDGTKNRGIV